MDWCDAMGPDVVCSNHPEPPPESYEDICESTFAGYRLPTALEFSVLLEETGLGNQDGLDCDGDDGDTMCTDMFGPDGDRYWSSSSYVGLSAWYANFFYGGVNDYRKDNRYDVRCVRSGP